MNKKSKHYRIGIDVGGTKMSAVLFDGKNVIDDYVLATPKDSLDNFMTMVRALIDPLFEKAKESKKKIAIIGLGIPGVLDRDMKQVLNSPNL